MSTTLRQPQAYDPGSSAHVREGVLRYGRSPDEWSWLLHRLTGVGVLLFLVIHIVDTFFVVAYPSLYDHTVGIYGGVVGLPWGGVNGYYRGLRWAFRVGELGLIASVLFHSLNGVRIVLFDFWPRAMVYRRLLNRAVTVLFLAIMIPVTIWVLLPLLESPKHWRMPEPAAATSPAPLASVASPL